MSQKKIKPGELAKELEDIVKDYSDEVVQAIPDITKKAAKTCVKELKAAAKGAGIGGSKYVGSFRTKETRNDSRVTTVTVHSTKYQLAHLLEHGHVIRNRPGGRILGTVRAFPHWAKAEEKASKELEEKIKLKVSGTS